MAADRRARPWQAAAAGTLAALLLLAAGVACGPDSGARPQPSPQPPPKAAVEGDAGGRGGWAR